MWRAFAIALVACGSSADPAPEPTPKPAPTPKAPLPPPLPDPPTPPNLQCYYNGPKEYIRLRTDTATMVGELERITASKAPFRHIRVKLVADGPIYDLIFDSYYPDDYKPINSAPRQKRTEALVAGKTEVARLVVVANKPRILGTGVDLHTGMWLAAADGSYPCGLSSEDPSLKPVR